MCDARLANKGGEIRKAAGTPRWASVVVPCVYVCMCVYVCVRACVRACMRSKIMNRKEE